MVLVLAKALGNFWASHRSDQRLHLIAALRPHVESPDDGRRGFTRSRWANLLDLAGCSGRVGL